VSLKPFTLLWTRPSSRGWTEPCELAACMLPAAPHRAAAQTRCRLRAGHRAEPVACRCRCRRRRARSLALQWCHTFVPTSARQVPARRRHPHRCAAVVRHALARTPEGLSLSVLLCNLFTHVLPWVQSSTFSG
jgi:hypothetical protein